MPMTEREQTLQFGNILLRKYDTHDPLFFLSGKHMYEIGTQSGRFQPLGWRRAGFIVGKSIREVKETERPQDQAAHLLNEMGGVWAHPIRVIDDFHFSITEDDTTHLLQESVSFTYHFYSAEFLFKLNDIEVLRTDFVVENAPALFSVLRVANQRLHAARLKLNLVVVVSIMPSWFAGFADGEDIAFYENGKGIAYDNRWPEQWGLVWGTNTRPESHKIGSTDDKTSATFSYSLNLSAGEEVTLPFLFAAENERGYHEAIRRFDLYINDSERLLEEKKQFYFEKIFGGVHFECSDKWFKTAFDAAKANLEMLIADLRPWVGRYLYAGIPEYVQLFGTDTAYSIPGLLACDYWDIAKDALLALARYGEELCGRIPHEVTTSGRVFHPGNTQETPQFTIACWNYFRWTGDRDFLEKVFPICRTGVADYVPAQWDSDLDYYPDGSGVVERRGMGSEKLDVICYFTKALYCLSDMAGALDQNYLQKRYRELADSLREAINADWWIERKSLYADSLRDDHSHKMDGHWIVAVPMETKLAPARKARRALARIWRDWVDDHPGMVHTWKKENFVWTLPTGVLAMGLFNYGYPDKAVRLLDNITTTIREDTLGSYKELIPQGLSFMQLWSSAIFLQGLIEGVFGLQPWADEDRIEISPQVPSYWPRAKVEALRVGEHKISIFFDRLEALVSKDGHPGAEKTSVEYLAGQGNFKCAIRLTVSGTPPVEIADGSGGVFQHRYETVDERDYIVIEFILEPAQRAEASCQPGGIRLEMLSVAPKLER